MNSYDVFNERGLLISGNSAARNSTPCLFYTTREWRIIENRIDLSKGNENLRPEICRFIQFKDNNLKLKNLVDSVNGTTFNNQSERGGGIYFNWFNNTITFYEIEGSVDARNYSYLKCESMSKDYGLLIGIVHTHPEEQKWWNGGRHNQAIFDAQYSTQEADGMFIQNKKYMLYSIGYKEIDFYSPKGKYHSKNGLCSNNSLLHGTFNIMKHALQMYGRVY